MSNYSNYRKSVRAERRAARAEERRMDRVAKQAEKYARRTDNPAEVRVSSVNDRPEEPYDADELVGQLFGNGKPKRRRIVKQRAPREKISPLHFIVGLIVVALALTGIVSITQRVVSGIRERSAKTGDTAQFNAILTPIAATDPDAFDDVSAADGAQLTDAAIWYILESENAPDTYTSYRGSLLIPETDVLTAYTALFGSEAAGGVTLTSVNGYNYTFEYDESNKLFKIPITSIEPIYTPNVTAVERTENTIVVTVEYIQAASWNVGEGAALTKPAADKVMKATFRQLSGKYYIASLQTVSNTVPETIAAANTAPNAHEGETITRAEQTTAATTAAPETTTEGKNQYLGGDVVW